MKALVLCAGRGTRLRPLTHTQAKAALPVAGEPVLRHILSYLKRYGFSEIGIVISHGQEELKRIAAPDDNVTFILQKRPRGIAHAVKAAREFLGQEPFLLYLGDILTSEDLRPALRHFLEQGPDALVAVRRVPNPKAFGVAELEGERILRVVEKPQIPKSDLAIAGIYLLSPAIHQATDGLLPSARGEYEITDAIERLIQSGGTVLAHPMRGWWQDIGTPEGILAANVLLLDEICTHIAPDVVLDSAQIQGRVVIGEGTQLENVRLRGPLLIGPRCVLRDAYLGPYTSVGESSRILHATIEHSILLPGCRLEGPPFHLEDCLLGRSAVVDVKDGHAVTILLGDDGQLQFPRGRR